MGVDDGGNVGSHPQDFGMDEDLVMPRHGSADPFALAIYGNDIVGRHFLEADAGGLHQKAPVAVRQTQCHVSGDVITLVLAHEHAARLDEFFAQSIGHVATLFRALPLWRPAAIPTLHAKRAPARGGHEPATRTRKRATPCRAGDHPARRRAFAPSRRADVIRWHAAGLCREGRAVRFRDGRARDRSAGDASFPTGAGRVRDLDTAGGLAARGHHRCRLVPGVDLAAALSCRVPERTYAYVAVAQNYWRADT